MSSIGTGYDLSCTTYSPDGRVFQVEYATKAVENASTVIGLRCKDGIILGVEKLIVNKLAYAPANKRIYHVGENIGVAAAGLLADARALVSRFREEYDHFKEFNSTVITGRVLCGRVARFAHAYTLHSSVRPFGVTALLASHSKENGPELFMIEPSGVAMRYFACAAGKGRQAARTELEKLDWMQLTAVEAVTHVIRILHIAHESNKEKPFDIDVSWICEQSDYKHEFVPDHIFQEAQRAALEALQPEDDFDDEMED
ncbi:hypothetical protein H696_04724 [Fonticula alba]|uniref:Proteasome subunit alpha type n=1 Tax=Fonticula alba TaxID=691883 RepID=A0A058Z2E9_FONAL|nr:hypothetical protein H696_04724 [Fonticula alba]KCV68430.1 hypothetical protein H696_04724 [Fonticula alba]|eukprot:XP_009496862.1 hypothetical protein H696_04724 [Fonticula alba]